MSLLMKALEKAAKDRGEARPESAPAAAPAAAATTATPPNAPPAARSELTLEPLAVGTPAAGPEAHRPATVPPRIPSPGGAPASSTVAPSAAASAPAREQAQAATVMQASAGRSAAGGGGVGEYMRTHPVVVLGTVASLFAVVFGIYVYLQIFHPGLLVGQPVIAPKGPPPSPIAQAPAPPPTPNPAEPLQTAPLLKEAAAESAAAAETPSAKPKPAVPAAPPPQEEVATRGNTIVVSPGSAEPVLNPLMAESYAALQSNQLDAARSLYQKVLSTEPKNTDALLGLAAIAARQGDTSEAVRLYLHILEIEPRHALAQSGLIALLGRADPLAAESRLRQLIARDPSAFLYFTLGNLYADQSQWAPAQQAYFQAHNLDSANPDYAYNLAVGLEHVSQPKLALSFYRRAAQLAATKGRSNFSLAQVQERIGKLAQQVE